ncbi:MAG TPA: hypothetical protein VM925_11765 [Labilithrix sp.]|nr:hypothetical protein [Labilithrix sp.]
MMRAAILACLLFTFACSAPPPPKPPPVPPAPMASVDPMTFLRGALTPWPEATSHGRLALTDPETKRVATYDSALVILVLIRKGAREEAARVIEGLHALQRADGSFPFSFELPRPDERIPYVRSGAVAWIGYAATEYLDSDRSGPARTEALEIARGAAKYLLTRQVATPGDPRDGLVRGGEGTYRYEIDSRGRLRERLDAEDIAWASVEHNVDTFFFFRALARVTEEEAYRAAATRIAKGLERGWSGARGQLARGVSANGLDDVLALDCASWGSIFLGATGDRDRAETSAFVADAGYGSRDPTSKARGHRFQRRGPLVEGDLILKVLGPTLPARDWSDLEAVWPEGSAGVALAAWRLGRVDRARAILEALEPLRSPDGSLPNSTVEIPFVFDRKPSIAGTAWVELVRFELGRPVGRPAFWAP